MKPPIATIPVILCALLAACHGGANEGTQVPPATKTVDRVAAPAPPPPPITGSSIAAKSDARDFSYSWPELPGDGALRAWLAKDAATGRKQAEDGARDDAEAAKSSGFPFMQHSSAKSWSVAGITPALLSLSAELADYTGGAHPNAGFQPLLWDRTGATPLPFTALLADKAAGLKAIAAAFCPALNVERGKRRGTPVRAGSTDEFDICPDLAQETIVPAEAKDGAFTKLDVLLGPYDAGPYVEGSYTIVVPVTGAFVATLKPAWRSAFRPG